MCSLWEHIQVHASSPLPIFPRLAVIYQIWTLQLQNQSRSNCPSRRPLKPNLPSWPNSGPLEVITESASQLLSDLDCTHKNSPSQREIFSSWTWWSWVLGKSAWCLFSKRKKTVTSEPEQWPGSLIARGVVGGRMRWKRGHHPKCIAYS